MSKALLQSTAGAAIEMPAFACPRAVNRARSSWKNSVWFAAADAGTPSKSIDTPSAPPASI